MQKPLKKFGFPQKTHISSVIILSFISIAYHPLDWTGVATPQWNKINTRGSHLLSESCRTAVDYMWERWGWKLVRSHHRGLIEQVPVFLLSQQASCLSPRTIIHYILMLTIKIMQQMSVVWYQSNFMDLVLMVLYGFSLCLFLFRSPPQPHISYREHILKHRHYIKLDLHLNHESIYRNFLKQ